MRRILQVAGALLALSLCQCGGNGESTSGTGASGTTGTGATTGTGTAGKGGTGGDIIGTGGGGGGAGGCVAGLQSLALSPKDSTVMLDGGPAAPVIFTATGTFQNGDAPVAASKLTWTATREDDTARARSPTDR